MSEKQHHSWLPDYREYPEAEMRERAKAFYEKVKRSRSVCDFIDRPVPLEVIQHCLLAAGTAPNGANSQPRHFAVVQDPETRRAIRIAAEEAEFYQEN